MFGLFTPRNARRLGLAAGVGLLLLQPLAANAAPPQNFATPEAAVTAMRTALAAGNASALVRIAGSDFKALVVSGEADVDKANWREAAARSMISTRSRPTPPIAAPW